MALGETATMFKLMLWSYHSIVPDALASLGSQATMTVRSVHFRTVVVTTLVLFLAGVSAAQAPDRVAWPVDVAYGYRAVPNLTYITANNVDQKLDLYLPRSPGLKPTLVYIHGGGWHHGTKEGDDGILPVPLLGALPYMQLGWAVVNVEYRLAKHSPMPAAVEDCRCALRWVVSHAKEYSFDTARIVVSGHSAGGHLALTTGILPLSAGFDAQCGATSEVKVAAIVNWFGITDVLDLIQVANVRSWALSWVGSLRNLEDLVKAVSPLTWVRPALPPIITLHGAADSVVPYDHAVRLHTALDKAGVLNELVTIPGGGHGFERDQTQKAYEAVWAFLRKAGVMQ